MPYNLILIRHGNSTWNQQNLFTGWVDVDLSDQGRAEADISGQLPSFNGASISSQPSWVEPFRPE